MHEQIDFLECCNEKTIVLDTRLTDGKIRRRRKCQVCKRKFSTIEVSLSHYEQHIHIGRFSISQLFDELSKKFSDQ